MTQINDVQLNPDEAQPLRYDEIPITCPCCSHVVSSKTNSISFDYWKGLVFKGDKQVWLEPMEADLLKILLDNWPEIISREKILLGLYGGNYRDDVFSDKFGVLMVKLRRKLKTFDIAIKNIRRRGWWLVNQEIRTPSQVRSQTRLT